MSTTHKSDEQLKQDIEQELSWDPQINAAQIGVTVDGGAVTLMGAVETYPEKWAAEAATKRVSGVRTVAQDLTVKLLGDHERSDAEIANAVQAALEWNVIVPAGITARVHEGAVTLEGQARWEYQRASAEGAVQSLAGVRNVHNLITLKPSVSDGEVKEKVIEALQRQAHANAQSITVATVGGVVTLGGEASTWQALEAASDAAWRAPGVTDVIDEMKMHAKL